MRKPGIEPGAQRWQRWILPLNHLRLMENRFVNTTEQIYWNLCKKLTPFLEVVTNQ